MALNLKQRRGYFMTDLSEAFSRRDFVQGALSGAVCRTGPAAALAAAGEDPDKAAVLAQIPKMHAENVRRLQDWIALPSIAAENRNYHKGAEHMAKLAEQAGFTGMKIIPTSGKPGVFGRLDSGAKTTVAVYFMYDVKQFVPEVRRRSKAASLRRRVWARYAWDEAR